MQLPHLEPLSTDPVILERLLFMLLSNESDKSEIGHTRNELAARLGVTAMTVGKVIRILLHADLIYEAHDEKGPSLRGRSPSVLRLTDRGVFLLLRMDEQGFFITVTDLHGTPLSRDSVPFKHALSTEDNLQSIARTYEYTVNTLKRDKLLFATGILYRAPFSPESVASFFHSADLLQDCDTLTRAEFKEGICRYGRTVLHLSFDRTITPTLLFRGEPIGRLVRPFAEISELRESLCQLFRICIPDSIIAEGRGKYRNDALSFSEKLSLSFGSFDCFDCSDCFDEEGFSPPRVLFPEELTLAERAMCRCLQRKLAQSISEEMQKR